MKLSKMLEVISSYEVIQGDINTEVNDIAFDSLIMHYFFAFKVEN